MSGVTLSDCVCTCQQVAEAVAKAPESEWKKNIEIALIVLIVLLVILGLILGLNKLRGGDDDEDEPRTYY